ncbi:MULTISPECIES: hypothetical protein [unclassified Flavobacterium]|uniref:hypothetical protein n=1 Tax=unclassified Flavobacterium TaxID=196869 RepID=UPI001F13DAE2|nr:MULTISPECIES: hypothetical protein [unclassified Flavobacterium]UMY65663.1 hypothetical protein MKO97_14330 [Flavobacterium sp. HJ-32-4]
MNTITYLKDVPLLKQLLGFSLATLGLVAMVLSSIIMGLILLVLGLNLLATEGSQINLDTHTYRNIKSLFGFHMGKWRPCPQFEYVSVFRTKENQTVRVVTAEATLQTDIILLNLFFDRNKHITFYKTKDKSDAFDKAQRFRSIFGIDILDATESEKKWL